MQPWQQAQQHAAQHAHNQAVQHAQQAHQHAVRQHQESSRRFREHGHAYPVNTAYRPRTAAGRFAAGVFRIIGVLFALAVVGFIGTVAYLIITGR
jgi:ferric-dicitrate binding protein FerR (iron transport regulator)